MQFFCDGAYEYQQVWVTDEDGKFIYSPDDSNYSSYNELGEWMLQGLPQPINILALPERIFCVDKQDESFPFSCMYLNPEICVFRGGKWYAVYDRN